MAEIPADLRAKLADVLGIEDEGGLGPDIVADVRLALAKARARGVQAGREAERTEAVDLLADLVDSDACSYDHHGHCQAHGWLYLSRCPHARAKEYGAKTHQKEER